MKIRQGFVSNSSSASYIVKIQNIEEQEFFDRVACMYCKGFTFEKEHLLELIEKFVVEAQFFCKSADSVMLDYWEKELKEYLLLKKQLTKINSNEDLVKFGFNLRGIHYEYKNSNIELDSWTSMHNSFTDGLDNILQEIILEFIFNGKYNITCEIKEDA